jgi:hypothetical protein
VPRLVSLTRNRAVQLAPEDGLKHRRASTGVGNELVDGCGITGLETQELLESGQSVGVGCRDQNAPACALAELLAGNNKNTPFPLRLCRIAGER